MVCRPQYVRARLTLLVRKDIVQMVQTVLHTIVSALQRCGTDIESMLRLAPVLACACITRAGVGRYCLHACL